MTEALYHVSDGDNKRTLRDMARSVVQFNSDRLDHSHGTEAGAGFQCLLFWYIWTQSSPGALTHLTAKEEDEHREVNSTFTLCRFQKYHL